MPPVTFCFGVHAHQPVGNFDHVFARSCEQAYAPFLDVLEAHPLIKVSLHYSGPLLLWLEAHRPALLDRVAALVRRGQVEPLAGGFYEPILPAIPERDRLAQIARHRAFVRDRLGVEPRGLWLAERVWEPQLAATLREAGITYLLVDDTHFKAAGLPEAALRGYYVTEDAGAAVAVFPILKALRYRIPFAEPEETLALLRGLAAGGGIALAVMADDAEKFGGWPGTHQTCYVEGWLDRFFRALAGEKDWLAVATFSEVLAAHAPLGRVYLPTASYEELMVWALPPEAQRAYEEAVARLEGMPDAATLRAFLRGGFWRNFLSKYPEANSLHKRMLRVSAAVASLPGDGAGGEAREALWRGQCNDAYWHGVFGGLYLPHLRRAVTGNLVRAETVADRYARGGGAWRAADLSDFDADGAPEVRLASPEIGLLLDPAEGGALQELDLRRVAFGLGDTLTRRREAYHHRIREGQARAEGGGARSIHEERGAKEAGLPDLLVEDWYRRASLLDHCLGPQVTREEFQSSRYEERGDFIGQAYEAQILNEPGAASVRLTRAGHLWVLPRAVPLTVEKTVRLPRAPGRVQVDYRLRADGDASHAVRLGVEFNWALVQGEPPRRLLCWRGSREGEAAVTAAGEATGITVLEAVDADLPLCLRLTFDRPARLWYFPLQTVSQSEEGYERIFQQVVLLPQWDLTLPPGEWVTLSLELLDVT